MSLADTESKIEKHLAAIMKLGKEETADKKKAVFLKAAADLMKEAKSFEKKQSDLNKRIKDAKALKDDIADYRKDWSDFIKRSVQLAGTQKQIDPDTKSRDYFMIATMLSMIGSGTTLEDYP